MELLPEGFPQDFPLYPLTTVTAAFSPPAPQGKSFTVGMESRESADKVRAFYEQELGKEPWQVENVLEVPEEATVIIEFARRDDGNQVGTVAISTLQEDGQRVTIAISLTVLE